MRTAERSRSLCFLFSQLLVALAVAGTAPEPIEHPRFEGLDRSLHESALQHDGRFDGVSGLGFSTVAGEHGDNPSFTVLTPDPYGELSPEACQATKIWDAAGDGAPEAAEKSPLDSMPTSVTPPKPRSASGWVRCALVFAAHCVKDAATRPKNDRGAVALAGGRKARAFVATVRSRQFSPELDYEPTRHFLALVTDGAYQDALEEHSTSEKIVKFNPANDTAVLLGGEEACRGTERAPTIPLCPKEKAPRGRLSMFLTRSGAWATIAAIHNHRKPEELATILDGEILQPSPEQNEHRKTRPEEDLGAGSSESGTITVMVDPATGKILCGAGWFLGIGPGGDGVYAPSKRIAVSTDREFAHAVLEQGSDLPEPKAARTRHFPKAPSRAEKGHTGKSKSRGRSPAAEEVGNEKTH